MSVNAGIFLLPGSINRYSFCFHLRRRFSRYNPPRQQRPRSSRISVSYTGKNEGPRQTAHRPRWQIVSVLTISSLITSLLYVLTSIPPPVGSIGLYIIHPCINKCNHFGLGAAILILATEKHEGFFSFLFLATKLHEGTRRREEDRKRGRGFLRTLH